MTLEQLKLANSSDTIHSILDTYVSNAFDPDIKVYNLAITKFGQHRALGTCKEIFENIPQEKKTSFTYNNYFDVLIESAKYKDAFDIYKQIPSESRNKSTFSIYRKLVSRTTVQTLPEITETERYKSELSPLNNWNEINNHVQGRRTIESLSITSINKMDRCNDLNAILRLVDNFHFFQLTPPTDVFNAALNRFLTHTSTRPTRIQLESIEALFKAQPETGRTSDTYHLMMKTYIHCNQNDKASELFQQIPAEKKTPSIDMLADRIAPTPEEITREVSPLTLHIPPSPYQSSSSSERVPTSAIRKRRESDTFSDTEEEAPIRRRENRTSYIPVSRTQPAVRFRPVPENEQWLDGKTISPTNRRGPHIERQRRLINEINVDKNEVSDIVLRSFERGLENEMVTTFLGFLANYSAEKREQLVNYIEGKTRHRVFETTPEGSLHPFQFVNQADTENRSAKYTLMHLFIFIQSQKTTTEEANGLSQKLIKLMNLIPPKKIFDDFDSEGNLPLHAFGKLLLTSPISNNTAIMTLKAFYERGWSGLSGTHQFSLPTHPPREEKSQTIINILATKSTPQNPDGSGSSHNVDYSNTEEKRAIILQTIFEKISHISRSALLHESGFTSEESILRATTGNIRSVLLAVYRHTAEINRAEIARARANAVVPR